MMGNILGSDVIMDRGHCKLEMQQYIDILCIVSF